MWGPQQQTYQNVGRQVYDFYCKNSWASLRIRDSRVHVFKRLESFKYFCPRPENKLHGIPNNQNNIVVGVLLVALLGYAYYFMSR